MSALFDHAGRLIPLSDPEPGYGYEDPDPGCYLIQPEIDYQVRLAQVIEFLPDLTWPSTAEFADICAAQLEKLGQDELVSGSLQGVRLPVCLPQMIIHNLGEVLDEVFLPAAQKALAPCPFKSIYFGKLGRMVSASKKGRHRLLQQRMAERVVIGVSFPVAMHGFSANASRRQIGDMSSGWILNGLDMIMAMIMYPEVFSQPEHAPVFWPLGFLGKGGGYSFQVDFYGNYLRLTYNDAHYYAGGHCASGMFFLG